ncbi:MAG: methylenetetrahydrofolate reductase [bacterium]
MRFHERLQARRFAVALEITPPHKPLSKVLLRRARLLDEHIHAVNVIQRPGRQTSLEASLELLATGIEPAWHLVTRGRSRAEIAAELEHARAGGIRQVLCILGDHPADDSPETPSIRDVIAMAHAALPEAYIGATLNQYGRDEAAVLRNLLPKLRAGARYVQTQPAFDASAIERYAAAVRAEFPETRVVAMAMPLLSEEAASRIEERLGIHLPAALREVLATGDEGAAWAAFAATLRQLVASPAIDGVAIMTFEMDATPESGERICQALRDSGALD